MTLRHLEIFVKVAETLNMTSAAEILFITQPSVSQSISELEQHLKIKLFERFGRRLHLTGNGTEFLSYARHIVSLSDEAERKMYDRQRGGTIRIGGSMTVGTTVLFSLVRRFMDNMPGCKVNIFIDNTNSLEKMLLVDEIDVALAEGTMKSEYIVSKEVKEDELFLICPKTHRFAGRDYVKISELADEDFIVREKGSGTRDLFESVMSTNEVKYRVTGVMNSNETIKLAVIKGFGISVLSALSVADEIDKNKIAIVRIEGINFLRRFSLFHHKNKYITPQMVHFVHLCDEM